MSHEQRKKLKKGTYHCYINSEFKKGYLVNGFCELKGKSKKINLISTYLCHPSLANDNLSGPLVMIGLYNKIKNWKKRNFWVDVDPILTIDQFLRINSWIDDLIHQIAYVENRTFIFGSNL